MLEVSCHTEDPISCLTVYILTYHNKFQIQTNIKQQKHSVEHLFNCQSHPTQLTRYHLFHPVCIRRRWMSVKLQQLVLSARYACCMGKNQTPEHQFWCTRSSIKHHGGWKYQVKPEVGNKTSASLWCQHWHKTDCSNNRPITLLSIPGKLFAHVLLVHIQLLLDKTYGTITDFLNLDNWQRAAKLSQQ